VSDLRRVVGILARHFDLPQQPIVKLGRAFVGAGKPISCTGATVGHFVINHWAVRGRHRCSWETLEYELVRGVALWLASRRDKTLPREQRPGLFSDAVEHEVLTAWYGPVFVAKLMDATRSVDHEGAGWQLVDGLDQHLARACRSEAGRQQARP
jgi:hypothetical protein